jgi:hypothetical protein
VVEKPECYKGEVGPQVCCFLSHFALWAANTGLLLNTLDTTTSQWIPNQDKWITNALSYMAGDAGIWAQPYIGHFTSGKGAPFTGDFLKFCEAFNDHFDPLSKKQQVIEALSVLAQGKDTVVVYMSHFKEIASHTSFSNTNLFQQYCMGLSKKIKSAIAISDCKQDSYKDIQETAVLINNCICNAEFKDMLQLGECIPSGHNPLVDSMLHCKPKKDKNAMDLDATYMSIAASLLTQAQHKEWSNKMKGRCFACTSSSHSVKDCHFHWDGAKCSWCTHPSHSQAACLQCFAGHPQGPPPPCQHSVNVAHINKIDSWEESNFDLSVASAKLSVPKSDNKALAVSILAMTLALGKDKGKKKATTKKPKADLSTNVTTLSSTSEADRHITQLKHMNQELLAQLKASQDSNNESIFLCHARLSKTAKPLDF